MRNSIVAEDDWSFVIKLHALMEAAVTHLLSETITISMEGYSPDTFKGPALTKVLAWMEISGKRAGKVTLASALGLTLEPQQRFISKLSDLRNDLVHDIKSVTFSFAEYVKRLDVNQKRNLIDAFNYGVGTTEMIKDILKIEESRDDFVLSRTKLAIWITALLCLSEIGFCILAFKNMKRMQELEGQMAKFLQGYMEALEPLVTKKGGS